MCLAIPMRVKSIDGLNACCEAKGIERTVSLFLMQHEVLAPGDMVVVHVGYAIQRMSEAEARAAWELYDEILDADEPDGAEVGAPDTAAERPSHA